MGQLSFLPFTSLLNKLTRARSTAHVLCLAAVDTRTNPGAAARGGTAVDEGEEGVVEVDAVVDAAAMEGSRAAHLVNSRSLAPRNHPRRGPSRSPASRSPWDRLLCRNPSHARTTSFPSAFTDSFRRCRAGLTERIRACRPTNGITLSTNCFDLTVSNHVSNWYKYQVRPLSPPIIVLSLTLSNSLPAGHHHRRRPHRRAGERSPCSRTSSQERPPSRLARSRASRGAAADALWRDPPRLRRKVGRVHEPASA